MSQHVIAPLTNRLRKATDIATFAAARHDCWIGGSRFIVWTCDASIGGGAAWGRLDGADVAEIATALSFDLVRGRDRPYDLLFDARRLEAVTKDAFDRFVTDVAPRLGAGQRLIQRMAILVPADGFLNALVHGTPASLGAPYPIRAFTEAKEGFAWLDREDLVDEVESIVEDVAGAAKAVARLRDWLDDHLDTPRLSEAAKALAQSTRTLQRELSCAGTSFRVEIERARIDAARNLLASTDEKIEAIAKTVGCASHSGFTKLFARVVGESPRDFRARTRP